jgi:pyruvate dehydrogenase E1 component alpha subunit
VLLELLTYRQTGHSRRDPRHYQPADERETWLERDPIQRFGTWLTANAAISPSDLAETKTRIERQIEQAVQQARKAPLPKPQDIYEGVYG